MGWALCLTSFKTTIFSYTLLQSTIILTIMHIIKNKQKKLSESFIQIKIYVLAHEPTSSLFKGLLVTMFYTLALFCHQTKTSIGPDAP